MNQRKLNLNEPLQARRWLRLWRDDPISGIRLQPNIRLERQQLGFSVSSNRHGLRGPDRLDAPGLILGTSFAMGLAVDEGDNWWEHLRHPGDWMNLGLPVGLREMQKMMDEYYRGPADTLCFVYHPNLLQLCGLFDRLANAGQSAFKVFGWRTDLAGCLWLTIRSRLRRWALIRKGEYLVVPHAGHRYFVDGRYCRTNPKIDSTILERSAELLHMIAGRFRRTLVFRVRIKQDIAGHLNHSESICSLMRDYEDIWRRFTATLQGHPRVSLIDADTFDLTSYHPRDTHWNRAGNRQFAQMVNRFC